MVKILWYKASMDWGLLGGHCLSVRAQSRTLEDFFFILFYLHKLLPGGNRRCSGVLNQEWGHPFSIKIQTGEGDEEHNERNCRKCKVWKSCLQETLSVCYNTEDKMPRTLKRAVIRTALVTTEKEIFPWLHPVSAASQLSWGAMEGSQHIAL